MEENEYRYWKKHGEQSLENEGEVRAMIEAGWLLLCFFFFLFSFLLSNMKSRAAFQTPKEEEESKVTGDTPPRQQVVTAQDPKEQSEKDGEGARQEQGNVAEAPTSGSTSLSLAEVMELVQRGEPVPGIRQIPSTLSEEKPTPSTMQPRPKPWETRLDQTPAQTQTQTPSPDNIQQQQ